MFNELSPHSWFYRLTILMMVAQRYFWQFLPGTKCKHGYYKKIVALHKKLSFPLKISSVNVTQSAGNCGFGHIIEEILNGRLHFLCSVYCHYFEFFLKIFVETKAMTLLMLVLYYWKLRDNCHKIYALSHSEELQFVDV